MGTKHRIVTLMNKVTCFSYFFLICILWVAYLEKEEDITSHVVVSQSSQGSVSFPAPLSKQKILWAKHSPDITILWKLKRTTVVDVVVIIIFIIVVVSWLLMENITKF